MNWSAAGLLADRRQSTSASGLARHARRYRKAVADRRASITAADRFYHDVLAYQWRLDALDAQLEALGRAADEAAQADETAQAAGRAGAPVEEAARRRSSAAEESLAAIDAQRREALLGLEARASQYALGVRTAAGHIGRLAVGEAERRGVIEWYRQTANDTYDDIASEARELLGVVPRDGGLRKLESALRRRRDFWQGQLEEAWSAWQGATLQMHHTGGKAMASWSALVGDVERVRCRMAAPTAPRAVFRAALAAVAARVLEVELLDMVGLSGLGGAADAATSSGAQSPPDPFSPEGRFGFLSSLLELLVELGALGEVGEALLDGATAPRTITAAHGAPPLLQSMSNVAAAVRLSAFPLYSSRRVASGSEATDILVVWLVECLVEAIGDVVVRGDRGRLCELLRFGRSLGGNPFNASLVQIGSQLPRRSGLAPIDLARKGGHEDIAELLVTVKAASNGRNCT